MQAFENIRCLIIDDEPIARRVLKNHLAKVSGYGVAGECGDALEGFHMIRKVSADLLFLDIQMPQMNGLELLRSLHHKPKVIIVSAHREFALEGFELDVVDYLLKPVSFERFLVALDKFRQRFLPPHSPEPENPMNSDHLFVRADRKSVRLILSDVLYIESMGDYLKIHTREQIILTKEKISIFERKLPEYFLRIHRSFIINTRHLEAFTPETAEIGGCELPISRSMRQEVMDAFQAGQKEG